MEHVMRGTDWGGFAFWMFIAACVVAGAWEKIRKNAEKHETLRTIIQKTGTVDEAKLKELFSAPTSDWSSEKPGDGYRALRVIGLIIMGIGGAAMLAFAGMGQFNVMEQDDSTRGVIISLAGTFVGLAIFWSSRYAEPPPGPRNGPSGR
jgi:hypothetical protein